MSHSSSTPTPMQGEYLGKDETKADPKIRPWKSLNQSLWRMAASQVITDPTNHITITDSAIISNKERSIYALILLSAIHLT